MAGRDIPSARQYDGFPQIENGVGIVRSFIRDSRKQAARFPERVSPARRLTLVTGELAEGFMREQVLPLFKKVRGLHVELVDRAQRALRSKRHRCWTSFGEMFIFSLAREAIAAICCFSRRIS